jgi:peptide-methionine (S)-S-oxide reductase
MSVQIRWGLLLLAGVAVAAAVARGFVPGIAVTSPASGDRPMITSKIAESKSGKVEKATFGAGCFWGVESLFRQKPGVLSTSVGYAGGKTVNPTYRQVCYDETGHAEVVQIEFDPEQISYAQLVDVFFACHNPTTLNSQGPDYGSQYRSVVFYHDDAQRAVAEEAKRKLGESGRWGRPIVTHIEPMPPYYLAEDYHQQYDEKNGRVSCHR